LAEPALIAQFFINARSPWLANLAQDTINLFNSQGYAYAIIYFGLVLAFTYFYTAITFEPKKQQVHCLLFFP
jgi:preprotein translocase subunit SecY